MKKIILALFVMLSLGAQAKQSLMVYNNTTGQIVYQQDIDHVRPLASITKLMTAVVALDYDRDLTRRLPLSKRVGGTLPRQTYSRYELLTAMLVRSDNAAAETLAADYPGGRVAFLSDMNARAVEYGMSNTRFDDPTGLSPANVSTASDIAKLVDVASGYWLIRDISIRQHADFKTSSKKRKAGTITLQNTNASVLRNYGEVEISKTGFTSRAGWCVAMMVRDSDQIYTVVVLGSDSKQHRVKTIDNLMYNQVREKRQSDVFLVTHLD